MTDHAQATLAVKQQSRYAIDAPPGRLVSLDVLRGLAVAGMILVVSPGSWDHRYPPLLHADWYSWTLADMVFPMFLFAVGVAIVLSLGTHLARGTSKRDLMIKLLRRSAVILVLGLVLNAFPTFDLPHLRIPGILQRIAGCYAIAGLLCLAFWRREETAIRDSGLGKNLGMIGFDCAELLCGRIGHTKIWETPSMAAEGHTKQIREWASDFGREYTDRNILSPSELDALWMSNYGVTRTILNRKVFGVVPQNARILEVGCNVGNQLLLLHGMGYTNLYGIEIQGYAVPLAQKRVPAATIVEGSALAVPFPDSSFDLVFTSGLLIHIAPTDLPKVLSEIHRVAKIWILGSEYYAPSSQEISYRGHENLLWKDDFAKRYLQLLPDLQMLQEQHLPYLNNPTNIDTMFLLQRSSQ